MKASIIFREAIYSICLTVFVYYVSTHLHSRFEHHNEVVHNQFAILAGQPSLIDGRPRDFPQFQSRILFPMMLAEFVRITAISPSRCYFLLRFFTAVIAFWIFLITSRLCGTEKKSAFAAALLLAYGMVFTFNHGWEHPTDFLDVMFAAGCIYLCLRKQRYWLLAWTIVATLNHQTAAFFGVIWFFLWAIKDGWRINQWRIGFSEAAFSGVLVIVSCEESSLVASAFRHRSGSIVGADGWLTIPRFIYFLHKPALDQWPVLLAAMAIPVVFWIRSNYAKMNCQTRRLCWSAVAIIALGSPLAAWSEIRSLFVLPLVIGAFAAAAGETQAASYGAAGSFLAPLPQTASQSRGMMVGA